MSSPLGRRRSPLRHSLSACTKEGITAEAVLACTGGAVTTAWALHLGCSTPVVGFLGALPFIANLAQVPAAWLTARLGARRAALWSVALSRQAFLPLVALPWLPLDADGRRATLVAVCAAHHGLGILTNNAWVTWVGELVPSRIRGRYFGRRTGICTTASAIGALAVGVGLDRGEAAELSGPALSALALGACAAGAWSVVLMARQHGGRERGLPWSAARALRPLQDGAARPLLTYLVVWNGAVGFSAPLFTLYLLEERGLGYAAVAAYGAAAAGARTAAAPLWGRAVDRLGSRTVLLACTAGLALAPVAWLLAGRAGAWLLALEALAGGALLAGHAVATFALPLDVAPARERPHYHAAFTVAGGVAFGLAAALGGALAADRAAPLRLGVLTPLETCFAASLCVRLLAVAAAAALLDARAGVDRRRAGWPAVLAPAWSAAVLARSFAAASLLRWPAPGTSRPGARGDRGAP